MKKIFLSALLAVVAAGCGKDDPPARTFTDGFDPVFAKELELRGYIADAKQIDPEEVKTIAHLEMQGFSGYNGHELITSLRGIEYFEALTRLICDDNELSELDVSKNLQLKTLFCSNNRLTDLNVSRNSELELLSCYSNRLKELDVSSNTKLDILSCHDNLLTGMDISKNTKLNMFNCHNNPGTGTLFPVKTIWDKDKIPPRFTHLDWTYDGKTVSVDYRTVD